MDKIVLERAEHSDFEDVMKISQGVYSGNDYLPYVYHEWVSQEERGFAARKNFVWREKDSGKVMGYSCLLKNGDYIISLATRFGANARGQGIIVKAAETFEMFKDHYFPGEKCVRITGMGFAGNVRQSIMDRFDILEMKAFLPLELKKGTLLTFDNQENVNRFKTLLWHEFKIMLLHNEMVKSLCCRKNNLLLGGQPFDLKDDGLAMEAMLFGPPSIFTDDVLNPCSLSIMQWPYPVPAGICLNMDIWTHGNLASAKQHFIAQLTRALYILKETGLQNSVIRILLAVDLDLKVAMKRYLVNEMEISHEIIVSKDPGVPLGDSGNVQVAHLDVVEIPYVHSKL